MCATTWLAFVPTLLNFPSFLPLTITTKLLSNQVYLWCLITSLLIPMTKRNYLTVLFAKWSTFWLSPFEEISILGNFNVHRQLWLFCPHWPSWWTNLKLCYPPWPRTISSTPYSYPWPPWRYVQLFDLFLTSNISVYAVTTSSPMGSSDHNLIILYFIVSLESLLRIPQSGGASGALPLLVRGTLGGIMLIFRGMTILLRCQNPIYVLSA